VRRIQFEKSNPGLKGGAPPGGFRGELGQVRGEIEFQPIDQMLHDLPHQMERIQERMSEVSEALRQRYFPVLSAPQWIREDM
jgi:hypothetical protein